MNLSFVWNGEEEFDPLREGLPGEFYSDEEEAEADPNNPVEFPMMREMPPSMQRQAVFTPEVQGGPEAALEHLFDRNPRRRPVLLALLDFCREGATSTDVNLRVEQIQADNRSVYTASSLCRMLERAGGLVLEEPYEKQKIAASHNTESVESQTFGVLVIEGEYRPIWKTTAAGISVWEKFSCGTQLHDLVCQRDARYKEVYQAILGLLKDAPRTRGEIEELVDSFSIVYNPRRFGGHFIDLLELGDGIIWRDHKWNITSLGEELFQVLDRESQSSTVVTRVGKE